MKFYQYIGRNQSGSTVEGWLSAESEPKAKERLQSKKIQPLVIRKGVRRIPLKIDRESLLTSMRELASLRKSGMGLDKAVQAIADLSEEKVLKHAWEQVYEMLHSGFSLSEAVDGLPFVFPRYVPSMIRLGEANGNLPDALYNIAERIEKEAELTGEIRSALTYPAFLIVFSVVILMFLFSFVLPNFESMVDSSNSEGSALASLLSVAAFFNQNILYISIAAIFSIGLFIWSFQQGLIQDRLYKLATKLPVTRSIIMYWDIIEFSTSMSRLLTAGVDLLEGARLSADGLSQDHLRRRLADTIKGIKRGESFANSLREKQVFPHLVIQMIAVGETGATLPESFREIAVLYERRLKNSLQRAITLLEPSVIVVMGGLIGSIMVILISGIISVNDISI